MPGDDWCPKWYTLLQAVGGDQLRAATERCMRNCALHTVRHVSKLAGHYAQHLGALRAWLCRGIRFDAYLQMVQLSTTAAKLCLQSSHTADICSISKNEEVPVGNMHSLLSQPLGWPGQQWPCRRLFLAHNQVCGRTNEYSFWPYGWRTDETGTGSPMQRDIGLMSSERHVARLSSPWIGTIACVVYSINKQTPAIHRCMNSIKYDTIKFYRIMITFSKNFGNLCHSFPGAPWHRCGYALKYAIRTRSL